MFYSHSWYLSTLRLEDICWVEELTGKGEPDFFKYHENDKHNDTDNYMCWLFSETIHSSGWELTTNMAMARNTFWDSE